jgi:hypothetical protein
VKAASIDLLRKLADMAPKPLSSTINDNADGHSLFNVNEYLSQHGLSIQREQQWQGGERRLILEHCPFNPEHKGTSAAVLQFTDGAIAFKCQHNGCAGKKWDDVRELFEPGYLERKRMAAEGDEILRSIHLQLNAKHQTVSENDELPVSRLAEEHCGKSSTKSFPESAWTGLFAEWRDTVSSATEGSLESLWGAFLMACGLVIGRRRSRCRLIVPCSISTTLS